MGVGAGLWTRDVTVRHPGVGVGRWTRDDVTMGDSLFIDSELVWGASVGC